MLRLPRYIHGTVQGFCCSCQETAILKWEKQGENQRCEKRWCEEHGERAIRAKFGDMADAIIASSKFSITEAPDAGRICPRDLQPADVEQAIASLINEGQTLTQASVAKQIGIALTSFQSLAFANKILKDAHQQNPKLAPRNSPYYQSPLKPISINAPVGRPKGVLPDELVREAIALLIEHKQTLGLLKLARTIRVGVETLQRSETAMEMLRQAQQQNPWLAPNNSPYYQPKHQRSA
jgi:hypothetical protein